MRSSLSCSLSPTEFQLLNLPASHLTRSQCNADTHIFCVDILQKDWVSLAIIARQNFFPSVQVDLLQYSYSFVIQLTPTEFQLLNLPASHLTCFQCNADTLIFCVDIQQQDCVSLAIIGRQNFFPERLNGPFTIFVFFSHLACSQPSFSL